jgi:hypothetical protein
MVTLLWFPVVLVGVVAIVTGTVVAASAVLAAVLRARVPQLPPRYPPDADATQAP